METEHSRPRTVESQRWLALDRLRATAVVLMIQGHTFSALLRDDALPRSVASVHAVLHGLTAPMFLFGAGLAFSTATYARYEQHRSLERGVRKRLLRYLSLALLGYALQLPGGSLSAALRAEGAQLALICRVGPLQLIAVTLGLSQLAALALRSARAHALTAALAGLCVLMAATPVARSVETLGLPMFLSSFLDDRGGANFPIFPWAAFSLFGMAAAGLLQPRQRWWRVPPLTMAGAALAAGAYLIYRSAAFAGEEWRTSPSYLVFRLGLVVMVFGLLHCGPRQAPQAGEAPPRWSALLATQSLVAYVVHLLVVYGTPFTPGLTHKYGRSLGLAEASLSCAAVLSLTVAFTVCWDWLERERLLKVEHKRAGLALLALSVFVR